MKVEPLSLILGAILGWLFQVVTDLAIKPYYEVELEKDTILNSGKTKILNLKIKNKKRFFIFNKVSTYTRAYLSFFDTSIPEICLLEKRQIARWNTTEEPIDYGANKVDFGKALISQREVICPGTESNIGVVIKNDNEKFCYLFNNESYLYKNLTNSGKRMSNKNILLRVDIESAETISAPFIFYIHNSKNIDGFKIVKKSL